MYGHAWYKSLFQFHLERGRPLFRMPRVSYHKREEVQGALLDRVRKSMRGNIGSHLEKT